MPVPKEVLTSQNKMQYSTARITVLCSIKFSFLVLSVGLERDCYENQCQRFKFFQSFFPLSAIPFFLSFLSLNAHLYIFYYTYMCICLCECSVALVISNSSQLYGLQPTRLLCPWDSPGKNVGVGCHALLQGVFLTQGSNMHLSMSPALQASSLLTEPPGKPICV